MRLSIKQRVGDIQEVTFLEGTSADVIAVIREIAAQADKPSAPKAMHVAPAPRHSNPTGFAPSFEKREIKRTAEQVAPRSVPARHEFTIFVGGTAVGRFIFDSMPTGSGIVFGENHRHGTAGFQSWTESVLVELARRVKIARGDLEARMTPKRDTFVMTDSYVSSSHPAMVHVEELDERSREALQEFANRTRESILSGDRHSPRAG